MSEHKFKVGDIVRRKQDHTIFAGWIGEVVKVNDDEISVKYKRHTWSSWSKAKNYELVERKSDCFCFESKAEPASVVNECLTVDNVNHPAHYNQGGIECIEAIKAATGSGFVKYCTGNVIKYLWRYDNKGGVEDLKKAAWYLDRAIKEMEVSSE
jgi:hypothetical protein